MKYWKRYLSAMLALAMLLGATGVLAEAPVDPQDTPQAQPALGSAKLYTHGERVTFVEGNCAEGPILDPADAEALVRDVSDLLGGDERTQFEFWRTLNDACGNRYYVFQQMYAETTVSGGAVKVVTDAAGNMLGLVSSIEAELPEVEEAEGIAAQDAEALVRAHALENDGMEVELVGGRTEKIILPVNLELDIESTEEKEESRFVWVVYSDNPTGSVARGSDLPYLAHYVTMDGTYLYSLPTIIPGDEAGSSGFDAAYVFEFMEPADYTGTVTLSNGEEQEITVTLMRDSRTGMYYLGNLERRIAVADCYEMLYNKGHVVLEASIDNTGWDDTCLLSLYNYCRAWDYYSEIGWVGGDGMQTPMLILKDYCDEEHNPVDNAAYAGKYYGWQLFLSSSANDLAQCLDVLGHEFTHCVTGSVMTYNAYKNDYGAINEAISDIQGNICEQLMGATDDTTWELGENGSTPIRNMSDPHKYDQPEYAWDLHYKPNVKAPTAINDRGGVHTNSSLLNSIAYRLCADGGMSLEDARLFWFAVDCSMVPGTDYAQLSDLLPWVLKNLGMDAYMTALEAAMDATRIRTDEVPEVFDEDRALVTLTLPDEERFMDGNWLLFILSVNVDGLIQRIEDISMGTGEYAGALDELMAQLGMTDEALPGEEVAEQTLEGLIEDILANLDGESAPPAADAESDPESAAPAGDSEDDPGSAQAPELKGLVEWYHKYLDDMIYYGTGVAGQDGRTMRIVCRPGLTIPVLVKLEFKSSASMEPKSVGLGAYTFGKWFDLTGIVAAILDSTGEASAEPLDLEALDLDALGLGWLQSDAPAENAGGESAGDGEGEVDFNQMLEDFMAAFQDLSWIRNLIFYDIKPGQTNAIPPTGIEGITLLDEETCSRIFSDFMETMDAESQEDESDANSRIDLDEMSLDALEALRDDIDQEIAERNAEAA